MEQRSTVTQRRIRILIPLAGVIVLIVGAATGLGSALHGSNRAIATFSAPTPGQSVDVEVTVAGRVSHHRAIERYFLVVQSEASGDIIFPQGELLLDKRGRFFTDRVRLLWEYRYRLFVVEAHDADAVDTLASTYFRNYGTDKLPNDARLISERLVVHRDHSTGRWLPSGEPMRPKVTWPPDED